MKSIKKENNVVYINPNRLYPSMILKILETPKMFERVLRLIVKMKVNIRDMFLIFNHSKMIV